MDRRRWRSRPAGWLRESFVTVVLAILFSACGDSGPATLDLETLQREVVVAETAFAQTMADRDHAGFTAMLADDALFFTGDGVLRGRKEVSEGWRQYYEGPTAPFRWSPERVEVLSSGTLALSTGPVFTADGERSGTFNSIWRREAGGAWRVVFDKGSPACVPCEEASSEP